jgi:hypothetical protein
MCKFKGMGYIRMNQLQPKYDLMRLKSVLFLLFLGLFQITGCGTDNTSAAPSIMELCSATDSNQKIISGQKCPLLERSIGRLDLYDEEDNPGRCTAIIVSPSKIISAAHCFDEFVFRARLTAGGESREVVRVVNHPEGRFSGNRFEHDIAVADLDSPLSFGVKSVSLAPPPQIGETIYIFGYGRITDSLVTDVKNQELFGGMMTVSEVHKLFFDALYDGRSSNTCRGDSGGPAYSFDSSTGKLQLSGLVSSGTIDSCTTGDVSMFTNLANESNRAFLLREAPEIASSVG